MQITLLNEKNIENSKYGYYHLCKKKVYTCMYVLIQNILYRISLRKTLKNCLKVVDQKEETGCLIAKGGNMYFLPIYTF